MAAGSSKRFGSNKLLQRTKGSSLIECAFAAVPSEKLKKVCVVTQYPEVEELAASYGFSSLRNPCPEEGISLTIRLGISELSKDCSALMFLVSDQPLLKRSSIEGLIDFYLSHPDNIIGAAVKGKRGNPCIFPKKHFPALCSLKGDTGGSAVIRSNPDELLLFEVSKNELQDVDTREDLK